MTIRRALIILMWFLLLAAGLGLYVFKSQRKPTPVKNEKAAFTKTLEVAPAVKIVDKPKPLLPAVKAVPIVCQTKNIIELADLINTQRAKSHLGILKLSSYLSESAQKQAQYLAKEKKCSHLGPDGKLPWQRSGADGELVGCGYANASDMLSAWLGSKPNRTALLFKGAGSMGIGVFNGYWVILLSI